MEHIEDASHDLCRKERVASERKKIRMAMRRRSSQHLLPDIGQPFLDRRFAECRSASLVGFRFHRPGPAYSSRQ